MGARTRHIKKFAGGRFTAQEVHAHLAFPPDAKCACGQRPAMRALTMCELAEATKTEEVAQLLERMPQALVERTVMLRGSDGKPIPYLRMGIAYACKGCTPLLEKALAKAPSHWVVEINRGPTADRIISSS